MEKRSHSLDTLFPLGLLGLFTLTAVVLILVTASLYRDTADRSEDLSGGAAALSYISEKLRQSDTPGALRLGQLADCPAVVITQGEENLYDTYIYCYDGALRELMIKRELDPRPEMGRSLVPMEELTLLQQGGLVLLRCTDPDGTQWERYLFLASLEAAA